MKLVSKLLAASALLVAAHSNAVSVDFTSPAWAGANNQMSFTVGSVTATAGPAGEKLYQDSIDGLGVYGLKEPDEIDFSEFIDITFDTDVLLASVTVSDFFNRFKDGGDGSDPVRGEVGYLSLWLDGAQLGSSPLKFFGDDSDQANGEQTISIAPWAKVDTIKFYTMAKNDDFSIKGLEFFTEYTNVPEPSIAVLLGLGLMGLGLSRRRQAKQA